MRVLAAAASASAHQHLRIPAIAAAFAHAVFLEPPCLGQGGARTLPALSAGSAQPQYVSTHVRPHVQTRAHARTRALA